MKLKLLIISVFLEIVCFSQSMDFNFALTDTSDFLYLNHFIILDDTSTSKQFYTTARSRFSPSERLNQIPVQYVDSAKRFYSYTFVKGTIPGTVKDSLISAIDLKKVKSFTIDIYGQFDHFQKKAFDISRLEILSHLDLPNLNSIEIKVTHRSFDVPIHINLPKWPIFKALVENDSLFSLKINTWRIGYTDKNLSQEIQAFRHLKVLYLPENINIDLLAFPSLEKVYFDDPVYLFSNSLVQLDKLKDFNLNVTKNNVNYASFTFFLNNIKETYLNHPVFYLDSLLKNYFPEKLKEGEVYLLGSEIMDADIAIRAYCAFYLDSLLKNHFPEKLNIGEAYLLGNKIMETDIANRAYYVFGSYGPNDTVVKGNITNGQMAGVWQYNFVNDMYGRRTNYYYDRDQKAIEVFPENGKWQYYYPNGNLAIEGNFLDGNKEGIWKFYGLQGKLASIKQYKKDTPYGLFIDYKLSEYEVERRRYYLNKHEYKTIDYDYMDPKQTDIFTFYSEDIRKKKYFVTPDGNNLACVKNGDIIKTIPRDSRKFQRLVYKHYVKYLYPERKKERKKKKKKNN